jgi:hypothetical protein
MIKFIKDTPKGLRYFVDVPEKGKQSFANFLRSLGYLIEFEGKNLIAK